LPFVAHDLGRLSGAAVFRDVAYGIARRQRQNHPRRFLKPRVENAFDFARGADIDPASRGQPDQAGGRYKNQKQSSLERVHDAAGLIR
jgi:hypothetical protein